MILGIEKRDKRFKSAPMLVIDMRSNRNAFIANETYNSMVMPHFIDHDRLY
jgi:hypothetical protein